MAPTRYAGGTVKIADSRNFKVAKEIAVAEVSVEPSSMRELHVSGPSLFDSHLGMGLTMSLTLSGTPRKTSGRTSCMHFGDLQ